MAKLLLCTSIMAAVVLLEVFASTIPPPPPTAGTQQCPIPPKEELEAAKRNKTGSVVFTNSSSIGFRSGRAEWGGCNGGQGYYGSRINQDKGKHSKNKVQAKMCLEAANSGFHWKWGCYRATYGECSCVVDSCFVMQYQTVFQQGLNWLSVHTDGFHYNEAERHEYNMYLHYSCNRNNEDIEDGFGFRKA